MNDDARQRARAAWIERAKKDGTMVLLRTKGGNTKMEYLNPAFEVVLEAFWALQFPDRETGRTKRKQSSGNDYNVNAGDLEAFLRRDFIRPFNFYGDKDFGPIDHDFLRRQTWKESYLKSALKRGLRGWLSPKVSTSADDESMRSSRSIAGDLGESQRSFSSLSSKRSRSSSGDVLGFAIERAPVKFFGGEGDRSGISMEKDEGEGDRSENLAENEKIAFAWKSPDVIHRDDANAFYYNAYITFWKVQRVLVVDENAKQVAICTPMNFAAYYVSKELRKESNASLHRSYLHGCRGINGDELDLALGYLCGRRCLGGINDPSITFDADVTRKLTLVTKNKDGEETTCVLPEFPPNGGWARFLVDLMENKMELTSIVEGVVSSTSSVERETYELIFRDEEVELLMGECRIFDGIHGVQFRGGAFGVFERPMNNDDALVVPNDRRISLFNTERRVPRNKGKKRWILKTDAVFASLDEVNE